MEKFIIITKKTREDEDKSRTRCSYFTPGETVSCTHAARGSVVPTADVDGVRTKQSALIYVCSMGLTSHLCYPVSCLIAMAPYCELSGCLMLRLTAVAAGKTDKRTQQNELQDKRGCAFHFDLR